MGARRRGLSVRVWPYDISSARMRVGTLLRRNSNVGFSLLANRHCRTKDAVPRTDFVLLATVSTPAGITKTVDLRTIRTAAFMLAYVR